MWQKIFSFIETLHWEHICTTQCYIILLKPRKWVTHTSLLSPFCHLLCEVCYYACLAGIWGFPLDIQSDTVIAIFKKMKLCGCHPDSETYNIMIDCCTILKSYRSACLLLSMMIRKGFHPVICTYNAIIEVLPILISSDSPVQIIIILSKILQLYLIFLWKY